MTSQLVCWEILIGSLCYSYTTEARFRSAKVQAIKNQAVDFAMKMKDIWLRFRRPPPTIPVPNKQDHSKCQTARPGHDTQPPQ